MKVRVFQALVISCLCMFLSAPLFSNETPRTMRVDYYHTGNALMEIFSLHQVVIEPLLWPGNLAKNIDNTNRGLYLFEIVEPGSNKVLYSRGYSSIFGEWQSTGEARKMNRTFHESVRFPRPDKPVRLRISKRDDANRFAQVWSTMIDPEDMLVVRKSQPLPVKPLSILNNGSPAKRVDVLIVGDGFTAAETGAFAKHARELADNMFTVSPFKEAKKKFNVWAINLPAPES